MRIAIITWCNYYNYGTYLQAFALQHYLKKQGYDAVTLDDFQFTQAKLNCNVCGKIKERIKATFSKNYFRFRKKNELTIERFLDFKNKYIIIDKDVCPLSNLDKKYDFYICGSDQIWNMNVMVEGGINFFFAYFTNKPKISYAPSFGVKELSESTRHIIKPLLKNFKDISVREYDTINELQNVLNRDVTLVADPTFLLNQNEWSQAIDIQKDYTKPYLLLYLLTYNSRYIKIAEEYAYKNNLDFRIIHSVNVNYLGRVTVIAGPKEFLYMIKNASFVFTDSFHACIFSIIFERQFFVFKRFDDNDRKSQNSRIYCLLKTADITDRLLDSNNLNIVDGCQKINYMIVKQNISNLIYSSKEFLQYSIVTNE